MVVTLSVVMVLLSPIVTSTTSRAFFQNENNRPFLTTKCWGWSMECAAPPHDESQCFSTATTPSVSAKNFHNMIDWGLVNIYSSLLREMCIDDTDGTPSRTREESTRGSLRCVWGTDVIGRDVSMSFCEGHHVILDARKSIGGDYVMYRKWKDGGLGFDCPSGFHENFMRFANTQSVGSQGFSWKPELAEAVSLGNTTYPPADCDIHLREPTLLVKADFPSHIYHHFTSILNAWLALHVAGLPADGSVRIVFVDKFGHRLRHDRPHHEFLGTFSEAWYPFTKYPILDIRHLGPTATNGGKKLCFDRAVFVHPPRTSFFYPTRGVGCSNSRLMMEYVDWMLTNMSFLPFNSDGTDVLGPRSQSLLFREDQPPDVGGGGRPAVSSARGTARDEEERPYTPPVRVTYITRHKNTKDRKLINEEILLAAITEQGYGIGGRTSIALRTVDFAGMSFREQVAIVRETDVMVGMHGAGLTHLMWLPRQVQDRVALVEIYNTEDEFCFKDLAALNGVKYFTWDTRQHTLLFPQLAAGDTLSARNAKQLNYSPDPSTFAALVRQAVNYVIGNPSEPNGNVVGNVHTDL
eukprot:m.24181 g.24181  ORF g.24181 m.24181 type:complete len:579 (-) comp13022_c0_seq1:610-2346(-)